MGTKYYNYLCLLSIALLGMITAHAQQKSPQKRSLPCNKSLPAAYVAYEGGQFEESVKLIKRCIQNYDDEVLFEAYRLLALCYLNMDNQQEATKATIEVLRHKNDYKSFPFFDPIEFTRLLAEYEVWPRLEIGIKTGLSINTVRIIQNYSVINSEATFMPKAGYQLGVVAEYFLQKKASVNAEILYEGMSYSRIAENVSGWHQEYTEKLNYITIPISGKYYFYKTKGFDFAVDAGFQLQLLTNSKSNILFENNTNALSYQDSKSQSSQRSKAVFYLVGGVSARHKLGNGNVVAGIRCAYGLNNVVNASKRYDDVDFIFNNQYVDSDFSFIPLYFSCSYQFPIPSMVKVSRIAH